MEGFLIIVSLTGSVRFIVPCEKRETKYNLDSIPLQYKRAGQRERKERNGISIVGSRDDTTREANVPSGPNKGDETRWKGRRRRGRVSPRSANPTPPTWKGLVHKQKCTVHGTTGEIISTARVWILDRGPIKKDPPG